jgi:hypothetical protein
VAWKFDARQSRLYIALHFNLSHDGGMKKQTDIEKIQVWLDAWGLAESTLGMRSVGNSEAVKRIRSESASIKTLKGVMAYIKDHPAETDAAE